jgi:single-stranded-DNA-specific exonuclease
MGISYRGIDFARRLGFTLIIALDCGIKSIDHVAYAKINRLRLIFASPQTRAELPDAVAVLIQSKRLQLSL